MLRRKYRLTKEHDFQRVRRQGQKIAGRFFVLSFVSNNLEGSRFGFIATKKIAKAARRNRALRLLRESVRLKLPSIRSGFDLVFIVRPGIIGKGFEEVEKEVDRLLKKGGFVKV